jgi:hypothetical protein
MEPGKMWLDDTSLVKVMPIHAEHDGMTLGANEMIKDGVYVFQTHLNAEYSNYSRACVEHTSSFNSDRWTFGDDTYVKYKLGAGNYEQMNGSLTLNMNYYIQGECVVEASRDDEEWQEVARLDEVGSKAIELPGTLYPTDAFYISKPIFKGGVVFPLSQRGLRGISRLGGGLFSDIGKDQSG